MNDASLRGLVQNMINSPVELITAEVVSESPLRVQLGEMGKMIIGDASLCVPSDFMRRRVKIEIDAEVKDAVIYDSFKPGEEVYLLWLVNDKRFVIIGRK